MTNFAGMDKEQAIALAERYKDIVAKQLPLKSMYLYGSYSTGRYGEDSDIDIAVIVERLNDNYFEDTPLLWKLRRGISNLIEPVLLTEDVNNPLYYDITRTGILI
jgi:predicted nucleotidyltransferase